MATQDFTLVCFLLSLVYIHKDVYMQLFMVMFVKPRIYQGSMHKTALPLHVMNPTALRDILSLTATITNWRENSF